MATKRPPSVTSELHRMVSELHAHSVETRVLIANVMDRLAVVEATVKEQGKTLSWYEFSIKGLKALGALAFLVATFRFGDISSVIKSVVTK